MIMYSFFIILGFVFATKLNFYFQRGIVGLFPWNSSLNVLLTQQLLHWNIMICTESLTGSGVINAVPLHTTLSSNGILGPPSTNGKFFCCPPGVATTNNAIESFNAMFKRSYTNHTWHTMASLYDIIHDRLLVDLSQEIIHGCKLFHVTQKPDRATFVNTNAIISPEMYTFTLVDCPSNLERKTQVLLSCKCSPIFMHL
jgi:hypothetical protein